MRSSPRPRPRPARRAVLAAVADPHDLDRFLDAQAGIYEAALAELRAGRKRGHWMWFVFPQCAGLGQSETSRRYAIRSLEEAQAYLGHAVLGARLRACVAAALQVEGCTAEAIFGFPDVLKFHSSLTLFTRAAPEEALFREALAKYCGGVLDPRTLALL